MPKSEGYKNLIPAKKGEVRNPYGRTRTVTSQLMKNGISLHTIIEIVARNFSLSVETLEKKMKDPKLTALEVIIIRKIILAHNSKDVKELDWLFRLMCGNQPQEVRLTGKDGESLKLTEDDKQSYARQVKMDIYKMLVAAGVQGLPNPKEFFR